jgi:GT2 family glycosyltransferase
VTAPAEAPSATRCASVVIVNFRSAEVVQTCLSHLFGSDWGGEIEAIVVDNSPGDGGAEAIAAAFPQVRLLSAGRNLGFGPANNLGFEHARGEFAIALNPDAYVAPDALRLAIEYLDQHPQVGIVGAQHLSPIGTRHASARMFPTVLDRIFVLSGMADRFPRSRLFGRVDNGWWDHSGPRAVDWVVGAFLAMRRRDWLLVGGFDPRFFLYSEEWDLCRRFRSAGLETHYLPQVQVVHLSGVSSESLGEEVRSGKQIAIWRLFSDALYYRKHRGRLGVAAMMGTEAAWTGLRWLRNRMSRKPDRRGQAARFAAHLSDIRLALRATAWGRHSPEQPWSLDRETYRRAASPGARS